MLAALRAGGGPHTPGFRPDVRVPQGYPRVSFQSMARTRSNNACAPAASLAPQYPDSSATRSTARVSFALPAAVNNRALQLPGSE